MFGSEANCWQLILKSVRNMFDKLTWLEIFILFYLYVWLQLRVWMEEGCQVSVETKYKDMGPDPQDINYLYGQSRDQPLNWKSLKRVNGFNFNICLFSVWDPSSKTILNKWKKIFVSVDIRQIFWDLGVKIFFHSKW